jgi:dynein heavy chain
MLLPDTQNCELSLDLMSQVEDTLALLRDSTLPQFRLFLTTVPCPEFPLGLLQVCVKVSSEPPAGLRAGMLRSLTTCVDQVRDGALHAAQGRMLTFPIMYRTNWSASTVLCGGACFSHCVLCTL